MEPAHPLQPHGNTTVLDGGRVAHVELGDPEEVPLAALERGLVAFEVGLVDDDLEERLLAAIRRRGGRLRLGRQVAHVAGPPDSMAAPRGTSWRAGQSRDANTDSTS